MYAKVTISLAALPDVLQLIDVVHRKIVVALSEMKHEMNRPTVGVDSVQVFVSW
jgi:hypothetical protein